MYTLSGSNDDYKYRPSLLLVFVQSEFPHSCQCSRPRRYCDKQNNRKDKQVLFFPVLRARELYSPFSLLNTKHFPDLRNIYQIVETLTATPKKKGDAKLD